MALFKAEVDRVYHGMGKSPLPSGTEYLFNNKKVLNFYQVEAKTWFNYDERNNRRDMSLKYRYNGGKDSFRTKVDEADTANYLLTTVTKISNERYTMGQKEPAIKPPATKITLRIDNIIRVEPWVSDSNFSIIWFEQGPATIVTYRVPHTLDEIEGGASGSGSLS